MDELRRKGLEKMNEVYSWEMPNIEGDAFFDLTVDHRDAADRGPPAAPAPRPVQKAQLSRARSSRGK